MPWLWAARFWMIRRGSGAGLGQERVERGDDGLAAETHEVQHLRSPLARVEAEFVLQAHHVAGAVVGHLRGQAVRVRAAVVDDVDHAGIVVAERGGLLDRRNRGHRLVRRHVHGVGRVPGKGCQSAGFRRIGRYEKGSNGIHWSPPVLVFHDMSKSIRSSSAAFLNLPIARVWICRTRSLDTPIAAPTCLQRERLLAAGEPETTGDNLQLPLVQAAKDLFYVRLALKLRRLLLVRVGTQVLGGAEHSPRDWC